MVRMQDLDFLSTVLGLKAPWRIMHADLDLAKGQHRGCGRLRRLGQVPNVR